MARLLVSFALLFTLSAPAARKTIALVPFDDLSQMRGESWLEKGMSAQIHWDLSLCPEVRVIDRARSHRLAQQLKDQMKLPQWEDTTTGMAEHTNADWIIFGSFRREGEQLIVKASAFQTASRTVQELIEICGAWNELLSFQDNIAERALQVLGITVSDELRKRMRDDPTRSMAAYENFFRAFAAWDAEENPKGSMAEAQRLYAEAIRIDPRYYKVLNNLGILREHREEFQAAEQYYRAALALAPRDDPSPHLNLANVFIKTARVAEALQECDAAKDADPRSVRPYLKKGLIRMRQGEFELAENEFRAALELEPDSAMGHVNLGVVYFSKRFDAAAAAEFRKAIHFDNDDLATAYAHNNLGNVHRRQRKWDEALHAYLEALRGKGDYAIAAMNAGDMYVEKRQYREATQWYERAIQFDPKLDDARKKLEYARRH